MILGATHGQQMGEGRRPQPTSTQAPLLNYPEMPPHYKVDTTVFKAGGLSGTSSCDNNKNSLNKNVSGHHSHSRVPIPHHPPQPPSVSTVVTSTHPQPFTAPWLTDVARMTPLSFPSTVNSSVAEYYHHYHNLPPRTQFYTSPFISPSHYIRDFPHPHQPSRSLPLVDSRSTDFSRASSAVVHPLRPPLPIPNATLDLRERYPLDLRDHREILSQREQLHSRPLDVPVPSAVHNPPNLSPKEHYGEPNYKKRSANATSSGLVSNTPSGLASTSTATCKSYNIPKPSPHTIRTDIPQEPSFSPSSPSTSTAGTLSSRKQSSKSTFHSHFKKGSLVTVGENVRRVEDLRTSDFIEAANAAEDLELDPSTVGAISTNAEKHTSTITFVFPSTNKEIPVEASDDHPFFVFHKGWSSCDPQRTLLKYDLTVRQLMLNDVCVSLRKTSSSSRSRTQPSNTDMPPPKTPTKTFQSSTTSSTITSVTLPSFSCTAGSSGVTSTITSTFVQNMSLNIKSPRTKMLSVESKRPIRVTKDDLLSLKDIRNLESNSGIADPLKYSPESGSATSLSRKRRWSDPGN